MIYGQQYGLSRHVQTYYMMMVHFNSSSLGRVALFTRDQRSKRVRTPTDAAAVASAALFAALLVSVCTGERIAHICIRHSHGIVQVTKYYKILQSLPLRCFYVSTIWNLDEFSMIQGINHFVDSTHGKAKEKIPNTHGLRRIPEKDKQLPCLTCRRTWAALKMGAVPPVA